MKKFVVKDVFKLEQKGFLRRFQSRQVITAYRYGIYAQYHVIVVCQDCIVVWARHYAFDLHTVRTYLTYYITGKEWCAKRIEDCIGELREFGKL